MNVQISTGNGRKSTAVHAYLGCVFDAKDKVLEGQCPTVSSSCLEKFQGTCTQCSIMRASQIFCFVTFHDSPTGLDQPRRAVRESTVQLVHVTDTFYACCCCPRGVRGSSGSAKPKVVLQIAQCRRKRYSAWSKCANHSG